MNEIQLFSHAIDSKSRTGTARAFGIDLGTTNSSVAEASCASGEKPVWGNDDPLFPATLVVPGPDRQFAAAGLAREHWSTASPIRSIFREAFMSAGLPYFNPHSFRNTLAQLGEEVCKTPEQFKAWSQNLGHEKVLTTFLSYGEVGCQRQGEIIRNLAMPQRSISTAADEIAEALFRKFNTSEIDFKKTPGP